MPDKQILLLTGELSPICWALHLMLHALHTCHQGSPILDMVKNQCHLCHVLFNSLNAELNPLCHLLALLGAHCILHVSRIRVK